MKRLVMILGLAGLVFLVNVNAILAKPDFSGTWKFNPSNSEGIPSVMEGFDWVLTIAQIGDEMKVKTLQKSPGRETTSDDTYLLDGKQVDIKTAKSTGKRTAKWSSDGKTIEIEEQFTFEFPSGPMTGQATSKWKLSEDGKHLTIDFQGEALHMKTAYDKQ